MLDLKEAKDYLRIDGNENDEIINSILSSIPPYLELTTGLNEQEQEQDTMCKQVSKCILALWYNPQQAETDKLQHVIDSLLTAISLRTDIKN